MQHGYINSQWLQCAQMTTEIHKNNIQYGGGLHDMHSVTGEKKPPTPNKVKTEDLR